MMLHRGGPQLVDRVYSRGSGAAYKKLKRDLWINALSATRLGPVKFHLVLLQAISSFMSLPFESTGN